MQHDIPMESPAMLSMVKNRLRSRYRKITLIKFCSIGLIGFKYEIQSSCHCGKVVKTPLSGILERLHILFRTKPADYGQLHPNLSTRMVLHWSPCHLNSPGNVYTRKQRTLEEARDIQVDTGRHNRFRTLP